MSKHLLEYWKTPAGRDQPSIKGSDFSLAPKLKGYHPVSNYEEYTVRNDIRSGSLWHTPGPVQPYIQLTARSKRWSIKARNLMSNLQFTIKKGKNKEDYFLSALADPRVPWNRLGAYQLYRYEMHETTESIDEKPVVIFDDFLFWIHEDRKAPVGEKINLIRTGWRWIRDN